MKSILFIFSFLAAIFFTGKSHAQSFSLQAWNAGGESPIESNKNMANSPKDNCFYTTGTFSYEFIVQNDTIKTDYSNAVYLAKFDYNTSLIWLKKIAENTASYHAYPQITCDTSGNIVMGIGFNDTLFFYNDTSIAGTAFVNSIQFLKIDANGNKLWDSYLPAQYTGTRSIGVDPQNNIIASTFSGSTSTIRKYDANLTPLWSKNVIGNSLFIDTDSSGNIYVCNNISTAPLYAWFDTVYASFPSGADVSYIAKYHPDGTALWVRSVHNMGWDQAAVATAMRCNQQGDVAMSGYYTEPILWFSNGYSALGLYSSTDLPGSFVTCFDKDGNRLFAKKLHHNFTGNDAGTFGIGIDNSAVYTVSQFIGMAANAVDTMLAFGSKDLDVQKFDMNGNTVASMQVGGTVYDRNNDLMLTGHSLFLLSTSSSHPFHTGPTSFMTDHSSSMIITKFHDETVGIITPRKNENLAVYPNPNNGSFYMTLPSAKGKITIFDLSGKLIFEKSIQSPGDHFVEIPSAEKGVYVLRFTSNDQSMTKKIVIH